jgi:uncharacterized membrane protein YjgN (DUF898 family)
MKKGILIAAKAHIVLLCIAFIVVFAIMLFNPAVGNADPGDYGDLAHKLPQAFSKELFGAVFTLFFVCVVSASLFYVSLRKLLMPVGTLCRRKRVVAAICFSSISMVAIYAGLSVLFLYSAEEGLVSLVFGVFCEIGCGICLLGSSFSEAPVSVSETKALSSDVPDGAEETAEKS